MLLVSLVYASSVSASVDEQAVARILETSRAYNEQYDITGLLCFNHRYFLQCLEGSRTRVNHLYQRILQDPRHSDILLLDYAEIEQRRFDQWAMGYVPSGQLARQQILRFSGKAEFNPYEMTGASACGLLAELGSL
ncbi:BLUF domain-containing protein [Marinobacter xestospongiae]|uniref:BLUF domain-containing protein n=1 Tax=Marinobacter xestospongiae TaxID=994319 RepID=UPI0020042C1D|nr:BLUF domain-containing protein [Marinobacter xestospongiae]MCK7565639.1 BLUF domain-containing protein [Marinobacter xestospongiae]